MSSTINFNIGDIVTLKSHPLFNEKVKKIGEFPAHVPPLMLIKEVFVESEEKKRIYSEVLAEMQIADLVKYTCVYFNANKSEFQEKVVYQSFLRIYSDLKYYREVGKDEKKKIELYKQLIPEVLKYKRVKKYEYGAKVQFKTKKLEQRKSYLGNFERVPGVSYQTPDFLLSGIKNEDQADLFYPDGNIKRKIPTQLYRAC